jgi:hypothetical protein
VVTWKNAVSAVKGQLTLTDKTNTQPATAGGNLKTTGGRKPANPITLEGSTASKADNSDRKMYVDLKVAQMASGDFPPQDSGLKPDPYKKILAQTLRLAFTWPADAAGADKDNRDKVTLNNPTFSTISK